MAVDWNNAEPTGLAERIWRLSGFGPDGNVIAFEIAAPSAASETVPFRATCLIGRDADRCCFVIPCKTVSRVHARLKYFPGEGFGICDLNSTNGTLLDGVRVKNSFKLVQLGSELCLGDVALIVSAPH